MEKTKLFFICLFFTASCSSFYAQTNETDPIVLPDITTVIDGEDLPLDEHAVPDFSGALPKDFTNTDTLPSLPDVDFEEGKNLTYETELEGTGKKNIFMEGEISLGWPYVFLGDFSVHKTEENPFLLRFMHDSVGGYGFTNRQSDFFDVVTEIGGQKTFSVGNANLFTKGGYIAHDDGMQGNSVVFDDINRRFLSGSFFACVPFGKGFSSEFGADGEWFTRFAGFADSMTALPSYDSVALSLLRFHPRVLLSWNNEFVGLELNGGFSWTSFLQSSLPVATRGDVSFSALLNFPWLDAKVGVGTVFLPNGSGLEGKSIVVPFDLGLTAKIPLPLSNMPLVLSLEGGITSKPTDVPSIEYENPFTNFTASFFSKNMEQSDWFAAFAAAMPVGSSFSARLGLDFRKTFLGNGLVCSDYERINETTGFFYGAVEQGTRLKSDLEIAFWAGSFAGSVKWQSHWLDVPSGQAKHSMMLAVSYLRNRWGLNFSLQENLGSNYDKIPEVDFAVFLRPTQSVKIELGLYDVAKLVTGKDRIFAEPYVSRSGCTSVSVHFMY